MWQCEVCMAWFTSGGGGGGGQTQPWREVSDTGER